MGSGALRRVAGRRPGRRSARPSESRVAAKAAARAAARREAARVCQGRPGTEAAEAPLCSAGHRHHFKRQGSKEGAGGPPGAQSDGGALDAAAESGSDSEPEGGSETSPAAEAQLTIDVPSDEEAYEAGLDSTSSATQPASAAPPSARSSKRSPSKALAHLEKRHPDVDLAVVPGGHARPGLV